MKKENIVRHILESREVKKNNIFGPYIASFIMSIMGGLILSFEYNNFLVFILFEVIMITAFVYSIVLIRRTKFDLYSTFLGLALMYLFLFLSFNYAIIAYLIVDGYTISTVLIFLLSEFLVCLLMLFWLLKNIKEGLKKWQIALVTILSIPSPYGLFFLLRHSGVAEYVSVEFGIAITVVCLGYITYPIMDNFLKAFYLKDKDVRLLLKLDKHKHHLK